MLLRLRLRQCDCGIWQTEGGFSGLCGLRVRLNSLDNVLTRLRLEQPVQEIWASDQEVLWAPFSGVFPDTLRWFGKTRMNPEHTREIRYLIQPGNARGYLEWGGNVAGEWDVWTTLLMPRCVFNSVFSSSERLQRQSLNTRPGPTVAVIPVLHHGRAIFKVTPSTWSMCTNEHAVITRQHLNKSWRYRTRTSLS